MLSLSLPPDFPFSRYSWLDTRNSRNGWWVRPEQITRNWPNYRPNILNWFAVRWVDFDSKTLIQNASHFRDRNSTGMRVEMCGIVVVCVCDLHKFDRNTTNTRCSTTFSIICPIVKQFVRIKFQYRVLDWETTNWIQYLDWIYNYILLRLTSQTKWIKEKKKHGMKTTWLDAYGEGAANVSYL